MHRIIRGSSITMSIRQAAINHLSAYTRWQPHDARPFVTLGEIRGFIRWRTYGADKQPLPWLAGRRHGVGWLCGEIVAPRLLTCYGKG